MSERLVAASESHARLLARGVQSWNRWREENPTVWPHLFELSMPGVDLGGVNLENANLYGANLQRATMPTANLRNTNLKDSRLRGADLTEADLQEANLHNADLRGTVLTAADLRYANLTMAQLDGAVADRALLGGTSFAQSSLGRLRGFEKTFQPRGMPSSIDLATLDRTARELRQDGRRLELFRRFVAKMGIPGSLLDFCLEAQVPTAVWESCFISHSSDDREFVERLDDALAAAGVPRFLAPRSSEPGVWIEDVLESNIALLDRVLVVCTEAALTSGWVELEVEFARAKREATGDEVILPLDVDGRLTRPGTRSRSAVALKGLTAVDFVGWKDDPETFSGALERLLRGLRADHRRRP